MLLSASHSVDVFLFELSLSSTESSYFATLFMSPSFSSSFCCLTLTAVALRPSLLPLPLRRMLSLPPQGSTFSKAARTVFSLIWCCFDFQFFSSCKFHLFPVVVRLLRVSFSVLTCETLASFFLWLRCTVHLSRRNVERELFHRGVRVQDRIVYAPTFAEDQHIEIKSLADLALDTLSVRFRRQARRRRTTCTIVISWSYDCLTPSTMIFVGLPCRHESILGLPCTVENYVRLPWRQKILLDCPLRKLFFVMWSPK